MGDIATKIGQPENILKTGPVLWTAITGTEQVSVAIPIAYQEVAVFQENAGIVINLTVAISGGATDGNILVNIYTAADNVTKDENPVIVNTVAYLVANTPLVQSFTFRMDEVGPSIIVGLVVDTGDRTFAVPVVTAYRWNYSQIMG